MKQRLSQCQGTGMCRTETSATTASCKKKKHKGSVKHHANTGEFDINSVDEHKVVDWQRKCMAKWDKYYKDGDATLHHSPAVEAVIHPHSEVEPQACPGCGLQITSVYTTHCCHKCHHHPGEHSDRCEQKPMPEPDDAPVIGYIHGIPEEMQVFFTEAHDLPAVQKLNFGHQEDITIEEVSDLFDKLKPVKITKAADNNEEEEEELRLDLEKIHLLLTHCLEPPCPESEVDALLAHFETEEPRNWSNHQISVTELFNIFTRGPDVKKFFELRQKHNQPISRDYLVEHISEIVDKNDYFVTLPMTILNLVVFVFLVMGHLKVYDRSLLETSLEQFVNGRDPRETCDENVDDMDSWWEWVEGPGLTGPFGNIKTSAYNSSWNQTVIAAQNMLVGDAQIHQRKFDGSVSKSWLRASDAGLAFLAKHPGQYENAAKAAAGDMKANNGADPDIAENSLIFNTYNEQSKIFAQVEVYVLLGVAGDVRSKINVDSVCIEAFPEYWLYAADALFILLTLYITFKEGKDMCSSLRLGCGEFADYWEFWNIIDWLQITLRVALVGLWVLVILEMGNAALIDLIDMDSGKLVVDVMNLTEGKLTEIYEAVIALRQRYFYAQWCFALNCIVVVLKFFKSFNANPRLQVVQKTFQSMSVDFAHFFTIFATIFLPFVLIGHILFGSDVAEFASLTASCSTGFTVMMGDFGWYADIPLRTMGAKLKSGKLVIWLFLWYFVYMILVVQVLLNMMLGIILDTYMDVVGGLHQEIDAPPIWKQLQRFRDFKKTTKKFVPLKEMLLMLENDDEPAHTDESVCATSLMKAFPGMDIWQSVWLICWLKAKQKVQKHHAEDEDDEEAFEAAEHEISEKIQELIQNIFAEADKDKAQIDKGMSEEEARLAKQDIYESEREKEVGRIAKALTDVQTGIAKMRRDQDKLNRKIETLYAIYPASRKDARPAASRK